MIDQIAIRFTRWVWRALKVALDPFELLYLAVAIATLDHSTWAGAYLFEGNEPTTNSGLWIFRGLLIAIAVDLGMLMTSRFLQSSKSRGQTVALIGAFAFAAITSAYLQTTYILIHTPNFVPSTGVVQYWQTNLMPYMDARVILLPFALPLLASIYTLARVTRHHQLEKEESILDQAEAEFIAARNDVERLVAVVKTAPMAIEPSKALVRLEDGWVDLNALTWAYQDRQRGPYKSRGTMLMAMQQAARRLEEKALVPADEDVIDAE